MEQVSNQPSLFGGNPIQPTIRRSKLLQSLRVSAPNQQKCVQASGTQGTGAMSRQLTELTSSFSMDFIVNLTWPCDRCICRKHSLSVSLSPPPLLYIQFKDQLFVASGKNKTNYSGCRTESTDILNACSCLSSGERCQ